MNVHELIAKLSALPGNLPVRLVDGKTTTCITRNLQVRQVFEAKRSLLCVVLAESEETARSYGENPPDNWRALCEPPDVCPRCHGSEQRWGVRRKRDTVAGAAARNEQGDWMGMSAFLVWTGTEDEANTAARKRNDNPRADDAGCVFVAEQHTCARCGKTNRRERYQDMGAPGFRREL